MAKTKMNPIERALLKAMIVWAAVPVGLLTIAAAFDLMRWLQVFDVLEWLRQP